MSALCKSAIATFSFEVAMREFDYILQTALFHAAVVDNQFVPNERVFIKEITRYGDVLLLLEKKTGTKISWDDIALLDAEYKVKMAKILLNSAKEFADDFVGFFAALDAVVTERDFLQELDECVNKIIVAFTGVDGEVIENESDPCAENVMNEINIAKQVYKCLLKDAWADFVKNNG